MNWVLISVAVTPRASPKSIAVTSVANDFELETITTPDGVEHDWRRELVDALVERQSPNGSWRNEVDRWEESQPALATMYATLALEEALKPVRRLE